MSSDRLAARQSWLTLAILALLLVSVFLRFLWLGRLPGINGDEAVAGVQIEHWLHHEPHTFFTLSERLYSPLFIATQAVLLACFKPTYTLLRLPAALWACAGLLLTFLLHRRRYLDVRESLLVTLLFAAHPLAIGYSRLLWDSSVLLATAPLCIYPALALAAAEWTWLDVVLLTVGTALSVASHPTALLLPAALGLALFLRDLSRGRPAMRQPVKRNVYLPWALVAVVAAITMRLTTILDTGMSPADVLYEHFAAAWRLVAVPNRGWDYLLALGNILTGARIFNYPAAQPYTAFDRAVSPISFVVVGVLATRLLRRSGDGDAVLGGAYLLAIGFLVATCRTIKLPEEGKERYAIWLVPLACTLVVRGLRPVPRARNGIIALLAMAFLFEICLRYFMPLQKDYVWNSAADAARTAAVEPKGQAAAVIRELTANTTGPIEVFAEDWWNEFPIKYLLPEARYRVIREVMPEPVACARARFVVGFADGRLIPKIIAAGPAVYGNMKLYQFPTGPRPIVSLIYLSPTAGGADPPLHPVPPQ